MDGCEDNPIFEGSAKKPLVLCATPTNSVIFSTTTQNVPFISLKASSPDISVINKRSSKKSCLLEG